jgi:PAS domain-containing protein
MFEGYFHSQLTPTQVEQSQAIIVISMTGRILHANPAACGFIHLTAEKSRVSFEDNDVFRVPPPLREFSERVSFQLEERIAADEWTQFEMKQTMRAAGRLFLLRGFGLPDILRRQQSRILLTLQPITGNDPV